LTITTFFVGLFGMLPENQLEHLTILYITQMGMPTC